MIGAFLTRIGLPVLIRVLAGTLKDIGHPATDGASEALYDIDKLFQQGQISPEQITLAHAHLERMAELEASHAETAMEEINQSLRAEIASQDKYVRRMRPTFGYLMALTWAAQMFGLAYVIIFKTNKAGDILEAMSSLGAIWAVGLSVLGIYVYKRSEDKKLFSSAQPGFLSSFVQKQLTKARKNPSEIPERSPNDYRLNP